ncbi:MAG: hypothetical protein FWD88_00235 [Treponema sp.]|nr:hypothetical protein [Treponema sp.]
MRKTFAKTVGCAAVLVLAVAFFVACGTGGGAAARPTIIPPTDIDPAVFDNFNHGFSSPLNGHNGQWGNNDIHTNGLGYWFGGVSSESMVLAEPFHGVHNRIATFGLGAAANSWGRIFQTRDGIPAPLGAPNAIGIRFMAREDNATFVDVTWAIFVHAGRGAGGPSAGMYFQLTEYAEWQEFFLEFPADFRSEWITGYDVWMRTFPPRALQGDAASAMSIAQIVFVYPEAAPAATPDASAVEDE